MNKIDVVFAGEIPLVISLEGVNYTILFNRIRIGESIRLEARFGSMEKISEELAKGNMSLLLEILEGQVSTSSDSALQSIRGHVPSLAATEGPMSGSRVFRELIESLPPSSELVKMLSSLFVQICGGEKKTPTEEEPPPLPKIGQE